MMRILTKKLTIGLIRSLLGSKFIPAAAVGVWILQSGIWDDAGLWIDSEFWQD